GGSGAKGGEKDPPGRPPAVHRRFLPCTRGASGLQNGASAARAKKPPRTGPRARARRPESLPDSPPAGGTQYDYWSGLPPLCWFAEESDAASVDGCVTIPTFSMPAAFMAAIVRITSP